MNMNLSLVQSTFFSRRGPVLGCELWGAKDCPAHLCPPRTSPRAWDRTGVNLLGLKDDGQENGEEKRRRWRPKGRGERGGKGSPSVLDVSPCLCKGKKSMLMLLFIDALVTPLYSLLPPLFFFLNHSE